MNRKICHPLNLLIIGVVLSWSVMAPAPAVSAETQQIYTAWIADSGDKARVEEPFFLLLGLDPTDPPIGYYVSVLVDIVEKPEGAKPEILTGFPKTRLTMPQAGLYSFIVRISLVAKSSCGGIDAEEILAKEIQLEVADR